MSARHLRWLAFVALLLAGCRGILGIEDVRPQPSGDGDGDGDVDGTWTRLDIAGPPPRYEHAMVYDPRRNRVLVFGGRTGPNNADLLDDTWELDVATMQWIDVTPQGGSPSPRSQAGLAYDAGNQRIVLYGGFTDGGSNNETFAWGTNSWVQLTPSTDTPSFRSAHAMFYDPLNSVVVLFGGVAGGSIFADTHVFDGADWAMQSTTDAPAPRSCAATAQLDGSREILFGGFADNGSRLVDTWQWEAFDWTLVAESPAPPSLGCPVMASQLDGGPPLVLAGDETWRFEGGTWSALATDGSPKPGASGQRMVGIDIGGDMLVFGGLDEDGVTPLNETWIFTPGP